MKKRILLAAILCCFVFINMVYADTDKQYTVDYTGRLTEDNVATLNGQAESILEEYQINAYFVMTDDTGELSTIDYTEEFYENNAKETDCVIFVLTSDEYYVLPLGKCADIFQDLEYELLYDAYINEDSDYEGIAAYYEEVIEIIENYNIDSQTSVEVDIYQGSRMNDDANIIKDITENSISDSLDDMSNKYDYNVVIFTSASMSDTSNLKSYYDFNYSTAGIAFMICSSSNEWEVLPIGDNQQIFTDDGIKYIKKQLDSLMKNKNYDEAVSKYAELCEDFLRQAQTGEPYDKDNLPKDGFGLMPVIIVTVGVALVVAVSLIIKKHRRKA